MGKFVDLTNKKFGFLTVLRLDGEDKRGQKKWLCRCECGKEKTVLGARLRSGCTKSCGSFLCSSSLYDEDIIGKRFGNLLVIGYPRNRMWKCVCDCGEFIDVHQSQLKKGLQTCCHSCEMKKKYGENYHGAVRIYRENFGEIPAGYHLTSLDGTAFEWKGNRNPNNLILIDEKIKNALQARKLNIKNCQELKKTAILSLALEFATEDVENGRTPKKYYIYNEQ